MDNLKALTEELGLLLQDEDLNTEKLQAASESLLPRLYDALIQVNAQQEAQKSPGKPVGQATIVEDSTAIEQFPAHEENITN